MKAIILAAGMGTRLRPLTDYRPKCMLKVGGLSVLERQLKILRKTFDDILVVLGYKKEIILKNLNINYLVNEDFSNTNSIHSLWLAKDFLDDDTLIINGDVLFDENLIDNLILRKDLITIGLTSEWSEDRGYKVKVQNNKIVEMGMDIHPIYGEYAGFILIRKEKLDSFKKKLDEMHKENKQIWFEDVFSRMGKEGERLGFLDVKDFNWYEFDTLQEYELVKKLWEEK